MDDFLNDLINNPKLETDIFWAIIEVSDQYIKDYEVISEWKKNEYRELCGELLGSENVITDKEVTGWSNRIRNETINDHKYLDLQLIAPKEFFDRNGIGALEIRPGAVAYKSYNSREFVLKHQTEEIYYLPHIDKEW